jgi:hypothetical protein
METRTGFSTLFETRAFDFDTTWRAAAARFALVSASDTAFALNPRRSAKTAFLLSDESPITDFTEAFFFALFVSATGCFIRFAFLAFLGAVLTCET